MGGGGVKERGENPVPGRCCFFLEKKGRFCRVERVKGGGVWLMFAFAIDSRFCGQHVSDATFVPCPYSGSHQVRADLLERHLRKCNDRPRPPPAWFKQDVNNLAATTTNGPFAPAPLLSEIDAATLQAVAALINVLYDEGQTQLGPITVHSALHPAHNAMLDGTEAYGVTRRHVQQNSSLSRLITDDGVPDQDTSSALPPLVVEFGAGRAHLLHCLRHALGWSSPAAYLALERDTIRLKADRYHRARPEPAVSYSRLRADIANVVLAATVDAQPPDVSTTPASAAPLRPLVACWKHLCGAATDFAIQAIVHYQAAGGVLRHVTGATCCHHRCTWGTYCNRPWLEAHGVTPDTFGIMTRMATMNVTTAQMVELGYRCKRALDYGRALYLRAQLGVPLCLVEYVDQKVTRENVCLTSRQPGAKT
ncbi:uncharacterized protein MONBRDRAFT_27936 [Monosiga brevicollis MX1]|uniref:tRNA:m(4)X modification enzyme TRM13 n=1 Tax=Monosiga brevicollis TaxID=81824 RepID=A9V6G4_MONBE|nr:uncharacterized protein MONBRDRAFT_27936 [Monosiga brevicollis MX1]EDQ86879.1 predicted protein [Monosiga brevicollis MX1]|eukprot:XP_001748424.1 hypothetical protein [Monosiga brevicollis MX1]